MASNFKKFLNKIFHRKNPKEKHQRLSGDELSGDDYALFLAHSVLESGELMTLNVLASGDAEMKSFSNDTPWQVTKEEIFLFKSGKEKK